MDKTRAPHPKAICGQRAEKSTVKRFNTKHKNVCAMFYSKNICKNGITVLPLLPKSIHLSHQKRGKQERSESLSLITSTALHRCLQFRATTCWGKSRVMDLGSTMNSPSCSQPMFFMTAMLPDELESNEAASLDKLVAKLHKRELLAVWIVARHAWRL